MSTEKQKENSRKYYWKNREKILEIQKEKYKEHPEMYNVANRVSRYSLSSIKFEEKMQKQRGLCAICRKAETATYKGRLKTLAVDHQHSCCSGRRSCGQCVRGLLCEKCNRALGLFCEDVNILKDAIKYLEVWNGTI